MSAETRLWLAAVVGRLERGLEAFGGDLDDWPWIAGVGWVGLGYFGLLNWITTGWWFVCTAVIMGAAYALRWVLPWAVRVCRRWQWWLLDWKRS
jgi:hypothetical protein